VIAAVMAAAPEVIVHQMTALAGMRSLRKPDKAFAATNELRTWGTDNLLAAAERAGTRRVIAQGYAGAGPDKPSGGALKTEEDPLDWRPIRSAVQGLAAIRHVDKTVPLEAPKGIVLRYGTFYGPGASDVLLEMLRKRQLPVVGGGTGVWSFIEVTDAAAATIAAVGHGAPGIYNVVDDDPAPVAEWLPYHKRVFEVGRARYTASLLCVTVRDKTQWPLRDQDGQLIVIISYIALRVGAPDMRARTRRS
jgi:nucleoside-diphosphate-sugar epimerase